MVIIRVVLLNELRSFIFRLLKSLCCIQCSTNAAGEKFKSENKITVEPLYSRHHCFVLYSEVSLTQGASGIFPVGGVLHNWALLSTT